MKRALLPTFCFAVLSTIAFEETVFAAQSETIDNESVYKSTKYVNVSSGFLNLRESASTSSKVIATFIKGTEVTVYSEANGWSKIVANGKEGYVSSRYLTSKNLDKSTSTLQTSESITKYVNVNSGTLNLRKSGSTSAELVTSLKKGTEVTVYSEANGWSKIVANGKEGYVSSKYLTSENLEKSTSSTPEATPTARSTTKYVNVSSGSLNLRKSGSTSATIITSLKKGTEVIFYSEANGWSKIKANGKVGYVSSAYLTNKNSDTGSGSVHTSEPTIRYVNVNSGSLNMRKSASTNASIILKLTNGKEVKVYSEANGWSKVEVFGQIGYVSSQYLTASISNKDKVTKPNSSAQQPTKKYVIVSERSSLNVRNKASVSGTVVTKLTKGTEVTVYSEANGWSKIEENGQEGYVSSAYLTVIKPNSETIVKPKQIEEKKFVNVNLGSSLNMRNSASTNSSIILKLARGVEITVYSEANGWSKVKAYEKYGYVSSQYLSTYKPSAGSELDAVPGEQSDVNDTNENKMISKYVNVMYGSALNLRTEASTSGSIVTKLSRGTIVTVYSEENDWARVTVNGKTGYVSSQYLSLTEPYNPSTPNDVDAEKITNYYDIPLSELTDIQMAVNPQTDKKYNTYIREDALTINNSTSATVKGAGWNVRGGAGTNFWVVGTVSKGQPLQILSKVKGNDGYDWYQVSYNKSWVNASPEDVTYYLDPNNFLSTPVDSLQYLKLSLPANLNPTEVNEKILSGKGSLQGLASAFITAGKAYNVNEIYLISHALLETGNGTSQLSTGVQINGKTVYNMYGIGAYDGSALSSGAQYAYNAGWFTPEAAIIGGSKFIAQGYINAGQDTLYKMRWNPSSSASNGYASNQYATDIGWAAKQVKQIHNLYSLIDSYKLVLDVPTFKN
ncbi:SH3 domain-containing protein [Metabacillus elymi]|uniref:SH3 domain-containing protein n=1 Tax=Metabacillus elymi TaxID=2745198 RepID=A0ABX6S7A5_9BACI|nr:SH3 domain-containing protein [Metabacillus sp. KUDC1714]QNF29477.1 SH3 domain-containing protein [Metabacillus sp. KUDC1714]